MVIVHTEKLESAAPNYKDQGIKRGESWIRRNLQEWPLGKELVAKLRREHGEETYYLDFYFAEEEDHSEPIYR